MLNSPLSRLWECAQSNIALILDAHALVKARSPVCMYISTAAFRIWDQEAIILVIDEWIGLVRGDCWILAVGTKNHKSVWEEPRSSSEPRMYSRLLVLAREPLPAMPKSPKYAMWSCREPSTEVACLDAHERVIKVSGMGQVVFEQDGTLRTLDGKVPEAGATKRRCDGRTTRRIQTR